MKESVIRKRVKRFMKENGVPGGKATPEVDVSALPPVAGPEPPYEPRKGPNGEYLPPLRPANLRHGVVLEFYPSIPGSAFNFWGMTIEDALTCTLDVSVRLNMLTQQAARLGVLWQGMSLEEVSAAITARLDAGRAEAAPPPAMAIEGGAGIPSAEADELRERQRAAVVREVAD